MLNRILIILVFLIWPTKLVEGHPNYAFILFDLDRTLLDFDASEKHALDKIYLKYFQNIPKNKFIKLFHEVNSTCWKKFEEGKLTLSEVREERFKILLEHLKIQNLDSAEVERVYELYLAESADWMPDTRDHFIKISKLYNVAIITNGYQLVQGGRIKKSGISDMTQYIFTSETIGHSKPHPLYFDYVFKEINISPQNSRILVVGDSLSSDFQGALNINADFCWVNPKSQTLPSQYPQPKYLVKNIKELYDLLTVNDEYQEIAYMSRQLG